METLLNQIIETIDEDFEPIKVKLNISEEMKNNKKIIEFKLFDEVGRYFNVLHYIDSYASKDIKEFSNNIKNNNMPKIEISFWGEYNFMIRKREIYISIFIKFSDNDSILVILNESPDYNLNSIQDEIDKLENKLEELREKKQIFTELHYKFD